MDPAENRVARTAGTFFIYGDFPYFSIFFYMEDQCAQVASG